MTSKGEDRVRLIMAATDDARISCCTVAWLHTHAKTCNRDTGRSRQIVDEDRSWLESVRTRRSHDSAQVGSTATWSSVSIAVRCIRLHLSTLPSISMCQKMYTYL